MPAAEPRESPKDRWAKEFEATRQWEPFKRWQEEAKEIEKRVRDEEDSSSNHQTRWNLFAADVHRMEAMLLGRVPQSDVSRRFEDAADDVARVAGDILERNLNTDLESQDDDQTEAWRNALRDWLTVGAGWVKYRYAKGEVEAEEARPPQLREDGTELAPAVPERERRPNERAEVDYFRWDDVLYGKAKTWAQVPWVAFRVPMQREEVEARWGEKVATAVPYQSDAKTKEERRNDPLSRVEVWEVWEKDARKVCYYVEGYGVLKSQATVDGDDEEPENPLGLQAFWAFPKPLMANLATSCFVPVPTWHLARDLYEDIDRVSSRITLIQRAIKVRGVYPAESGEVKKLLEEGGGNDLFPIQNWPALMEKGGLEKIVQFLPLDMLVNALTVLMEYRREMVDQLHQVQGTSDIQRGQATQAGATATEQRAKVRFGTLVAQSAQDEFARFISDSQCIKAEIMARHFESDTLIQRSNILHTPDRDLAQQAVELLQSDVSAYRVVVRPESVQFQDFAVLKEERTEIIGGIAGFMQSMRPLVELFGMGALPFFIEMLQWYVAGLRGASGLESVLDKASKAAETAAQQPQQAKPDPKLAVQQVKGQQEMQKIQMDLQADLQRIAAETDADAQREANQMAMNTREHLLKTQITAANRPPDRPSNGEVGV